MKKVLLGLFVVVLCSGCGEIYIKAGTRHIDEHVESEKTSDRPMICMFWWTDTQCGNKSREVQGS